MDLIVLGPNDPDRKLTENFNTREFRCPCCARLRLAPNLVEQLQKLRDEVQVPIHISSGYRCPVHNEAIGGARHSRHLITDAADIYSSINLLQLFWKAFKYFSRIGIYDTNFLHVDLYSDKGRLFWTRIDGIYKYFSQPEDAVIYFMDQAGT